MNTAYDKEAAVKKLDSTLTANKEDMDENGDESNQHLLALNDNNMNVTMTGERRTIWRISTGDAEFTFRIQGILVKCNLIPGDIRRTPSQKVHHLSQQVALSGLGSALFEEAASSLNTIEAMYQRYFHTAPDNSFITQDHVGGTQIAASNKFYTNRSDDPDATKIPFGLGVDPFGYLEKASTDQHVHSHDNIVAYFKQVKDSVAGTVSYEDAFPGNFRVGDIVSIEAALYAFQNEQKRIRLHINLRAMTLIDSKFSKDAEEARIKANAIPRATGNKLRRGIPFEKRKRAVRAINAGSSSGTTDRARAE